MTSKDFKRVARILKAAYKKVEEQARKNGMDLMSKDYETLIDRVRETVLKEMGFTLAEYKKIKAKVDPKSKDEVIEAETMERSALPFESEMKEIATNVAKDIIPPPQTLKQIFQYDDSSLKKGLKELSDRVGKTVTQEELKARADELKTEILTWNSENFSENFQKNIDVLGMPNFRKLAMGLQAQIDDINTNGIEGAGDVTGPASSTDNAIVRFDSTTGKIIQNSVVTIADTTGNMAGVGTLNTHTIPGGTGTIALTSDIPAAGANTALSNLASVAINTSLVSDTDNTDDLGTTLKKWANLFITTIGATATRVTKGWFTDIESTNMPTVGGTAILTSLTAPQFTTIELGHATENTLSAASGVLSIEGVAIPTISSTSTLTNKRVTQRVTTTTDDATSVINIDTCDVYELSAVANNTEFTVTGTPTDGQKLIVRYKDAGVSKTLTWTFATAIGITLPAATTAGKWGYVGCVYNSAATQWHAVAVTTQA